MDKIALGKLKGALTKCLVKTNNKEKGASIAYSASGREYLGVTIESETNIMDISPEQAALAMSTISNDFPVTKIITMYDSEKEFSPSPIVLKIITDYQSRTQKNISHIVVDTNGVILFETGDVSQTIPIYKPSPITISRTQQSFSPNKESIKIEEKEIPETLKKYALKGLTRNFPLYESASGYGTAVYTSRGEIYFGGQYSSPDKRLGMHSEMTTIISAILDDASDITHIGLVSTKYKDSPCNMCGSCRQFIAEMSSKLNFDPKIFCFSHNNEETSTYIIRDYLPSSWTSKKWTTT